MSAINVRTQIINGRPHTVMDIPTIFVADPGWRTLLERMVKIRIVAADSDWNPWPDQEAAFRDLAEVDR